MCGHSSLIIKNTGPEGVKYSSALHRCKRWDCPECRKYKASLVAKKIMESLPAEGLYMMTLTLFRRGTPQEQWKHLNASWNRLLTYLRRKFGTIQYVAIREPHAKGGTPHLHVLLDKYVWTRETQRHAVTCGFGFQKDFQRCNNDGAKYYVTKYLTKEHANGDFEAARKEGGNRVVTVSRNLGGIYTRSAGGCIVARYLSRAECDRFITSRYNSAIADGYIDAWLNNHFYGSKCGWSNDPPRPELVSHSIEAKQASRSLRNNWFRRTVIKTELKFDIIPSVKKKHFVV